MHLLYGVLLLLCTTVDSQILHTNTSAIFVFGDSSVDSGNNNFIPTMERGNFTPYGHDFPGQIPTGRFTNGRLLTDFIASYMGIKKLVPPYLDPNLTLDDLRTGVCFASAGSGLDPLTSQITSVISMEKQLQYFTQYKVRMEGYLGKARAKSLINKATAFISVGTNDFLANYFLIPTRNQTYSVGAYRNYLLRLEQRFIEEVINLGVRNIAVVGLPPFGCVPASKILYSCQACSHHCVEWLSVVARDYNRLLQSKLAMLKTLRANIVYLDIYRPLEDLIRRPQVYGFNVVDRGCCGRGGLETSILCAPGTALCSDGSKYVFWDSSHPTQAAYFKIFQSFVPALRRFYSKFVM